MTTIFLFERERGGETRPQHTMEICRLTIPIDPNTLSVNASKKRKLRENLSLKRRVFESCRYAWIEAGRPTATGRVILHLIVRRGREMDTPNIWGGMKVPIDALFVGAITPDDRPKYLELGHIEQQIDKKFAVKPEVVFIVESL